MEQKNIELLKKLKALAERGAPGEMDNAQRMLDRLIKKYGINERDLDDEIIETYYFKYKTREERQLIMQVLAHTNIIDKRLVYEYRNQRGKIWVDCTKAESVQIGIEYDFFRAAWKEELDFFLSAFIQKHRIVDLSPGHATDDSLSYADQVRMGMLISGMKDRYMQPRLEEGQ